MRLYFVSNHVLIIDEAEVFGVDPLSGVPEDKPKELSIGERYKENLKNPRECITF